MVILTPDQVDRLKQELVDAATNAGWRNCLGSVKNTVDELFDLRGQMIKEELRKQLENVAAKSLPNVDSFLNREPVKFKLKG